MSEALSASLEDYLEAIFHITAQKQAARAKDIAKRLKVSGSSVTGALRSLAKRGLINYAPYDIITLTTEGQRVAEDVTRRHEVLRDFFVKVLAVGDREADQAACRMEHSIPREILERFVQFAEFVEVCPRGGYKWVAGFGYHCDHGSVQESCERCIARSLVEVKTKKAPEGGKSVTAVNLKDLRPGEKGTVLKVVGRGGSKQRIVEMGMIPGTLVEVERVAPLGDPIEVKMRGYHLSLRKEDAAGIEVKVV